jgi:hypothetical protein
MIANFSQALYLARQQVPSTLGLIRALFCCGEQLDNDNEVELENAPAHTPGDSGAGRALGSDAGNQVSSSSSRRKSRGNKKQVTFAYHYESILLTCKLLSETFTPFL